MDSNHRRLSRQIYSLLPLATREPTHEIWSWRRESNPQPADYKSAALPIELRQHERPMGLSEEQKNGDAEGARTLDLQRDRLAF